MGFVIFMVKTTTTADENLCGMTQAEMLTSELMHHSLA